MKGLSLAAIASACGGTCYGPEELLSREITGVAIDSRKIEEGFLFVPIKGARVDGHDFIEQVMEKGALCSLSEHSLGDVPYPYIVVESTEQALKDLARYYRSRLNLKVIGITGSVGKTSTKELIASVLAQKYHVLKTEGNYNNEIGLPLTIFRLTEEDEIAVLEMGIDHFGEMHRLADIARPDVCVITNIGYAHLESLGSREGILKAKTEMFDHLQDEFCVVLNGDDDMLRTVSDVRGQKPDAEIVFISIKPSPRRMKDLDRIVETNAMIREFAEAQPNTRYADVFSQMLDADGSPVPEYYREDGLHLTAEGYKVWRKVLSDYIK